MIVSLSPKVIYYFLSRTNTPAFNFSEAQLSFSYLQNQDGPKVRGLCERQGYMKTDDFVWELRQYNTELLSGGVALVDYITGVWCLCAY